MERKTDLDWARVARWAVAVALYLGGCTVAGIVLPDDVNSDRACSGVFVFAVAVFWLLKVKARREQQRRIDAAELRAEVGQ